MEFVLDAVAVGLKVKVSAEVRVGNDKSVSAASSTRYLFILIFSDVFDLR